MALRWNPLTGKLDLVVTSGGSSGPSNQLCQSFSCDASLAVNDWVYQDPTTDEKVLKTASNTEVEPTIGIVKSKPTDTTCEVVLLGIHTGLTLAQRGKFWLSDAGEETFSFPTSGTGRFVRRLGVYLGNDTVYVNPDLEGLCLDDG